MSTTPSEYQAPPAGRPDRRRVEGRGEICTVLLLAHLVLSPLVFSGASTEVFELPKMLLLHGVALALVGIGLAPWLFRRPVSTAGGLRAGAVALGRDPIALGVLALLASASLSTAFSASRWTALLGDSKSFAGLTTIGAYAVLFFAARSAVSSGPRLLALLWAAVVAGTVASAYAALQLAGVDPIEWTGASTLDGWTRVGSAMGHPNLLAALLAMTAPLAAVLARRAWRDGDVISSTTAAALATLMAAVTVATLSRAGWLALGCAVAMLVVGWWRIGDRSAARTVVLAVLAGVLASMLVGVGTERGRWLSERLASRAEGFREAGGNVRIEYWSAAVRILAAHPLAGAGPDSFRIEFPKYRGPEYSRREWDTVPTRAHNEPLQVAATQGAIGLAGLTLLAVGLVAGWRRVLWTRGRELAGAGRPATGQEADLVVAIGASLAAYVVQGLFGFTVAAVGGLFAIGAGALSRLAYGEPESSARPGAPRWVCPTLALCALLASCVLAVNAWLLGAHDGGHRLPFATLTLLAAAALPVWRACRWLRSSQPPVIAADTQNAPQDTGVASRLRRLVTLPVFAFVLYHTIYVPFVADLACRRGSLLIQSNRPREAVVELAVAVDLARTRDDCWRELGIALFDTSLSERIPQPRLVALSAAQGAIDRALVLVPESPAYRADRARAQAELSRVPGAAIGAADVRASFDEALDRDPLNVLLLVDASRAAILAGDLERAERLARRAAKLEPDYGPAAAQLGMAAMGRREWAQAERLLSQATRSRWHGDLHLLAVAWANLARVRLETGAAARAIGAARRALAASPELLEGLIVLARAHEQALDELKQQSPSDATARRARSHRDEAIDAYRRILRLTPANREAREALSHHLGG